MRTIPLCGSCARDMAPYRTGVLVVELAHDPPTPYRLQSGDEFYCRDCGARAVTGWADKATPRHDSAFEPILRAAVNAATVRIIVVPEKPMRTDEAYAIVTSWLTDRATARLAEKAAEVAERTT